MKNKLIVSVCASALAACSGGGDGGGGTQEFTSFSDVPDNATVQVSGKARTAPYTANLVTGQVTPGAVTSDPSATILVRTEGGTLTRLAVRDTDANIDIDENDGAMAYDNGEELLGQSGDLTQVAAFADPDTMGFEYQTYGVWANGYNTGSGSAGVGTFGSATDAESMPSGIIAVYTGGTGGIVNNSEVTAVAKSDLTIETDFETVSIETTNTEGWDVNTGAYLGTDPDLDLSGSGTVSGSGFTGTVSSGYTSGDVDGQFYGPNAEEVGGTFSTSGGGITYVGSFGGAQ